MRKYILLLLLTMMTVSTQAQKFNFKEVDYTPEKTIFNLFAPSNAKTVTLRIYNQGSGGKAIKTAKMQKTGNEQWTTTIKGDLMGKFYTFDMGKGECAGDHCR